MNLRTKLTATLLVISLASAASVGGVAYWMLMRDFREAVQKTAFEHFQADVQAYIRQYGSWQQAVATEPFHQFVAGRRFPGGAPRFSGTRPLPPPGVDGRPSLQDPPQVPRYNMPPFRFLLLDLQGRVLNPAESYQVGQMVDEGIRRAAQAIRVDGQVRVFAYPLGTPQFSMEDRAYLDITRKALLVGMLVAALLASAFGLLMGNRMSASLRELTAAIRSLRPDGSLRQQVSVRSRDEMGLLAAAFNRMSDDLAQAHAEVQQATEQMQHQAEQLKELSIRDPLTYLFNRRYFDEQAELMYRQAVRYGHPLCVMVGDLDFFKDINDRYSHSVGDQVLRRIADLLRQHTRSSDVVARYGGEEFIIVFVEIGLAQAVVRCEQLRQAIENYPWHEISPDLRVTMSMGLCDDTSSGSVEKMLATADDRLYEAKSLGRNRVEPEV